MCFPFCNFGAYESLANDRDCAQNLDCGGEFDQSFSPAGGSLAYDEMMDSEIERKLSSRCNDPTDSALGGSGSSLSKGLAFRVGVVTRFLRAADLAEDGDAAQLTSTTDRGPQDILIPRPESSDR